MSDPFVHPRRWCVSGCFQPTGDFRAVKVIISPDPAWEDWCILERCKRCHGVDWIQDPDKSIPRFATEAEALHRIARLEHAWRCQ